MLAATEGKCTAIQVSKTWKALWRGILAKLILADFCNPLTSQVTQPFALLASYTPVNRSRSTSSLFSKEQGNEMRQWHKEVRKSSPVPSLRLYYKRCSQFVVEILLALAFRHWCLREQPCSTLSLLLVNLSPFQLSLPSSCPMSIPSPTSN